MDLDPDVRAYYDRGREAGRLSGGFPSGPLELERTKELVLRFLPDGAQTILDVGGGAGVHAAWLQQRGHEVRLVEPVPLHVEQATAAGIPAELGEARDLSAADASVDVVLLLGPLYHLLEPADRARALAEAHRVLRPGGLLFAAGIGRYSSLFDLLVRADALDDELLPLVADAVQTGVFRGGQQVFTNAYLHLPAELRGEVADAGFRDAEVFNIEGPGALVSDFEDRWADPEARRMLMEAARLTESHESLGGAGHLLCVATAAGASA